MDTELLVPYGTDPQGTLVRASEANHQTIYHCPGCNSPLVLRAGEKVIHHFAHKANSTCTGETVAHQTAKRLLVQVIMEQSISPFPKAISIFCPCSCCNKTFSLALPARSFTSAQEEHRIDTFVCDVVAFRDSACVLAIEVFMTHAVEEKKALVLSVPWLELSAEAVLENPYQWRPTKANLKPVLCPDCKKHVIKLRELAERWNLAFFEPARYRDPSRATFLAAIETCWKCKNEIPVYWWRGVPFCETEPPSPRPRTIQHRYSKTYGGSYWANTCPECDAVQGDNFLFLDRSPVFAGLPLRESPEMAAHRRNSIYQLANKLFKNTGL